jgi:hypothetical protein
MISFVEMMRGEEGKGNGERESKGKGKIEEVLKRCSFA